MTRSKTDTKKQQKKTTTEKSGNKTGKSEKGLRFEFQQYSKRVGQCVSNIPERTRRIMRYCAFALLFGVGLFLVLMPISPQLPYYIRQLKGEQIYERQDDYWGETIDGEAGSDGEEPGSRDENTLVIPAIGIDVNVVEGTTDDALNYGAWHRPGTSTPVAGGNMVITGHRFRYLPPSNLTFYHLDKVEIGDDVIVYWDGKEYDYLVTDIFVVEPEQVEIEADTASPRLTLYTCTPLWTANQRLVVIAEPVVDLEEEDIDVELESLEE